MGQLVPPFSVPAVVQVEPVPDEQHRPRGRFTVPEEGAEGGLAHVLGGDAVAAQQEPVHVGPPGEVARCFR